MAHDAAPPPGVANRMRDIRSFHVMRILARARELETQGRDIIHMEIGEPDFPTPEPVVRAGRAALAAGHTQYTPAMGLPPLREAIAKHYRERLGVEVDPGRIIITPGASGALQLVLGSLVDPGDEVLMPDPGYPCNRHMVRLFEGKPVSLPTREAHGFVLRPDAVGAAWRATTRALMLATPANPTGVCLSAEEMAGHYGTVRRLGGSLIVDEIYQGLEYGHQPHSALGLGHEELFVVNSFSKFFGMTGWRVGWVVAPADWVPVLDRLAQNIFLAAPTPSQHAALAALSDESLAIMDVRRDAFARRRDILLAGLRELGFTVPGEPAGAFYVYADCSALSNDATVLAERLLEETGVAVTPGVDFSEHDAQRYLRFAYTTDEARIGEGLDRMAAWFSRGG